MAIMIVWMLLSIMLVVAGPASCFDLCKPLSDTNSGRGEPCGNGQCVCTGSKASCFGYINGQFHDTLPVLGPHVSTVIARCYNFSNMSKATFKNIDSASIEKLNVSQCNLREFAGDSFVEFQNLTVLELSKSPHMNLTQMIEAIQPLNRSLNNLTLTDNMLKDFDISSYLPFTSLKYLDISGNRICKVAANVSLVNLIYLNLRRNLLHCREMRFCYNVTSITHTRTEDRSENSLERIEKRSIFPQLRILDLGRNYLGGNGQKLNDSFDCLWNLEQLDLSNNTIRSVSMSQFKNLNNLRNLLLSSNWIKCVNGGELPPKLERIDFRDNQMTLFPPKLCDGVGNKTFPSLTSLDFGRNFIVQLTTDWHKCLPNLEWLDFSRNDARWIKNNTFVNYTNLKYLFLSNLISWTKVIEPAAFNSSSLQKLNLRFNWMNFSSTASLRRIFWYCPNLSHLDISYNYITDHDVLNETIYPLKKLESLHLEKLQLVFFPFFLLQSFQQLKVLNLDHNIIYTVFFPYDFNNASLKLNIIRLSVSHSYIHTINESTFPSSIRRSLKYLDLSDNQFRCGCAMRWFRDAVDASGRVKDSNIQLIGLQDQYYCRSPSALGGDQFWTFQPIERCSIISPVVVAFVTVGCSLFVFSVLTGVAFRNRWYIKYWWFKIARIRRAKEQKGTEREHLMRQNEQYDAYVVYNAEDNMFVHHSFRELVENELGYRLHIWERDADNGPKVDVVLDAMYAAKHVIVAVSNNILKDQWAKFQVDVALDKSIKENCEVLFVKLDNLDLARISKTWCVLMTRTPTFVWSNDKNSIETKLLKEVLLKRLGKPLNNEILYCRPNYN